MEMNEAQKAYLICKERGHQPSEFVIDTFRPYNACKHCGTTFRYRQILEEARTPFGWVSELKQDPTSEAAKIVLMEPKGEG